MEDFAIQANRPGGRARSCALRLIGWAWKLSRRAKNRVNSRADHELHLALQRMDRHRARDGTSHLLRNTGGSVRDRTKCDVAPTAWSKKRAPVARGSSTMTGVPITNSASSKPCDGGASGNPSGGDATGVRATSSRRPRRGQQLRPPKPAWPEWRRSTQYQSGPPTSRPQQSSFDNSPLDSWLTHSRFDPASKAAARAWFALTSQPPPDLSRAP